MPQTRNATRIQQMDVSNKQLKKMANKLSATNDIESAFAILLKDPQFGDARAMDRTVPGIRWDPARLNATATTPYMEKPTKLDTKMQEFEA